MLAPKEKVFRRLILKFYAVSVLILRGANG
jgi:hypothetical protein